MTSPGTYDFDAIVVGAGFAGLYAVHRLREQGLSVQGYERGGGVGGVWYWNRYPGARCDIESMEYSYSFSEDLQQEWEWQDKFSAQGEILRYLNHVADKFDLRRSIRFGTSVAAATYDDAAKLWTVRLDDGTEQTTRYLVLGVGCLANAMLPPFEGIDDFAGEVYHTGQWPHGGVDFAGKRVGIVGTGSSGVQAIPMIAQQRKSSLCSSGPRRIRCRPATPRSTRAKCTASSPTTPISAAATARCRARGAPTGWT